VSVETLKVNASVYPNDEFADKSSLFKDYITYLTARNKEQMKEIKRYDELGALK